MNNRPVVISHTLVCYGNGNWLFIPTDKLIDYKKHNTYGILHAKKQRNSDFILELIYKHSYYNK